MTNKNLASVVAALVAASPIAAMAQTSVIRPAYQYPPSTTDGPTAIAIPGTPIFYSPYVGVAVGHDDNVLMSSDNERGSTLYVVGPGFRFDARTSSAVFQGGYQARIGRYTDSEDDNYIDHDARAQLDLAFDRRNYLRLGLMAQRSHDARGSTDRGFSERPDRYRLTTPSATYAFGAPGAQGRVELYYTGYDKRYLNNRAATESADRTGQEFGGAFYWRVMPKTYLLAEARRNNINYREPGSPFSGDERRYYAGVSWDATAATTGTVKVGRMTKRFDTGLPEFSGTSWEASIAWSPRTYSKFDFYTARQTNEATGQGRFILTELAGVNWTHSWNSVLQTGVDLRYTKDDYQGFDRTDETYSLGLKVGYKFRRWLTLGAEYNHIQRDSNRPFSDYDRNLYLLTATAAM